MRSQDGVKGLSSLTGLTAPVESFVAFLMRTAVAA